MTRAVLSRRAVLAAAAASLVKAGQAIEPAVRLNRKVRLAMLGFDGHPDVIVGELRHLPDVEPVAVYDANPKQLEQHASKPALKNARRYSDYRELLDREKIDVAGVCGPTPEHTPAILACAERGIHVVSEKPLALNMEDLTRVKEAVEKSRIGLSMLLPMRFYGVYRTMREVVLSGAIGEPAQIDAQKSYKLGDRPDWMRDKSQFGGTIPYIGIHMVDLIRFTSGHDLGKSVSMQARVGHPELRDMQNTTGVLFHMDNGGIAVMHLDYLRPEKAAGHGDDRLRIAGTKGVVEYSEHRGLSLMTDQAAEHDLTPGPNKSLFIDFLQSIYNGKTPSLSQNDIYRANEIVLLAQEAKV